MKGKVTIMIRNIVGRIEPADRFWSVREDLHTRFGGSVEPSLIDSTLDAVSAEFDRDGGIGAFRKIFVEREAVAQLAVLSAGENISTYPSHRELDHVA